MGIVAAIARVRAGAKSAGIEGALSTLGAELKSEAIPERLRDVAGRLAALLGSAGSSASSAAPAELPSLELALDQHASKRVLGHASEEGLRASAAPDAVCPFTGLRADEMRGQPASPPVVEVGEVGAPVAASVGASAPTEPSLAVAPAVKAAEPPPPSEQRVATDVLAQKKPASAGIPPAPVPASKRALGRASDDEKRALGRASDDEKRALGRASDDEKRARGPASEEKSRRVRSESQTGAGSREKRKERLAGASPVANTSGRSATRPAAKRPRSRAESTRKKT